MEIVTFGLWWRTKGLGEKKEIMFLKKHFPDKKEVAELVPQIEKVRNTYVDSSPYGHLLVGTGKEKFFVYIDDRSGVRLPTQKGIRTFDSDEIPGFIPYGFH